MCNSHKFKYRFHIIILMTKKTFEEGVNIARKTVLDIIEQYNEKPSDDLQEDLKNEINKALDKILEESK